MVTPEELSKAACNDQAWKQINRLKTVQLQNVAQHVFMMQSTFLMLRLPNFPRAAWRRLESRSRNAWGVTD